MLRMRLNFDVEDCFVLNLNKKGFKLFQEPVEHEVEFYTVKSEVSLVLKFYQQTKI